MGGSTARWMAVVSGMLVAAAAGAAASARPVLIVHVDARAPVPPHELDAAKAVVERTFMAAGVDVTWTNGRFPMSVMRPDRATSSGRHIALMLVNNSGKSAAGDTGCTLGFAAPRQSVAYVFYNRVVAATARQPADVTVTLGRVIVHEIGHLLLPPNSHAPYGIMRPDLDLGVSNPGWFTKPQARAIRAHVAGDLAP